MMQQTMLRVKDPARSLDSYTRVLGMTLLQKIDFPSMRFTHYFLGYENKSEIPKDVTERTAWTFSCRDTLELTQLLQKIDFPSMRFTHYFLGYENKSEIPKDVTERTAWTFSCRDTLELTHNWGSESDEKLWYHNGNREPLGFGHVGIAVPDVSAACRFFEDQGVEFVKRPDSGQMKELAFIQDADKYWIKIYSPDNMLSFLPP